MKLLKLSVSIIIVIASVILCQQIISNSMTNQVLSLITLLAAGVTTPMIDMEATISQISFELLGHAINFENQVLYFQSKSILDMF